MRGAGFIGYATVLLSYSRGDLFEIDPEWLEFASLGHADIDARKAAREMLAEKLLSNEHIDGQRFEIADEAGTVVETVTFKSVRRLN